MKHKELKEKMSLIYNHIRTIGQKAEENVKYKNTVNRLAAQALLQKFNVDVRGGYKGYTSQRSFSNDIKVINSSKSPINLEQAIQQLPPILRNNPEIIQVLCDLIGIINESYVTVGVHKGKRLHREIISKLIDLGMKDYALTFLVPKITNINDITINGVTFEDFQNAIYKVFKEYSIPVTEKIDSVLGQLFLVLYLVYVCPRVEEKKRKEIEELVKDLRKVIDKVELIVPRFRKGKYVNKKANQSIIKGQIMVNIESIIGEYKQIIDNEIAKCNKEIEKALKNITIQIIEPVKQEIEAVHNEIFSFRSSEYMYTNKPKLAKMDQEIQDMYLSKILELSKSSEVMEILQSITPKEPTALRMDALSFDTKYSQGITKILSSRLLSGMDKQFILEKFSLEYEFNYFKMQFEDTISIKGTYTLFREYHDKLIKGIEAILSKYIINDYEMLRKLGNKMEGRCALFMLLMGNNNLVNLSFFYVIKILSNRSDVVHKNELCVEMGQRIYRASRYLKEPNILDSKLKEVYPDITTVKDMHLDIIEITHLGLAMLENILEKLPVLTSNTVYEDRVTQVEIKIHPDYINMLCKEGLDPFKLPMICPPLKWSSESEGGYLTEPIRYLNNKDQGIIHQNYKSLYPSQPNEMQYLAINYLNEQRFVINKEVLSIVINEWSKDEGLFGPYNKLHPDSGDKTVKVNSKDYKQIQAHNSIHWNYRNIINMAILFRNTPFYIPTFMDFRGRIYPEVCYLSYQGNDLARALIHFDKAENLNETGLRYLKLYLANVYGLSTKEFEARLEWIDNNLPTFYQEYSEDPSLFMSNTVRSAKEPFQFLSTFQVLYAAENENLIKTGQPILFDCSCSGIQHLSALCANISLAKMVNVISSERERSDLYSIAANFVSEKISNAKSGKLAVHRDELSQIDINRSIIKIPIMTTPYNISLEGMVEKLEEKIVLEKIWEKNKCYYKIKPELLKGGESLTLNGSAFGTLTSIIYNTLYEISPPIKEIIQFLKTLVGVLHAIDKPVIWITPSLMKITMSTRVFKPVKTSTKLFGSAKPITITIPTEKLDQKANQRGFSVNMIHSLDAANIHILIQKMTDKQFDLPLYTIHDCFATTPNYMLELNNLILASFIELYFETNYIAKVYRNLLEQIESYGYKIHEKEGIKFIYHPISGKQIIIPDIPTKILEQWGENKDVFVKSIKQSTYFIS